MHANATNPREPEDRAEYSLAHRAQPSSLVAYLLVGDCRDEVDEYGWLSLTG